MRSQAGAWERECRTKQELGWQVRSQAELGNERRGRDSSLRCAPFRMTERPQFLLIPIAWQDRLNWVRVRAFFHYPWTGILTGGGGGMKILIPEVSDITSRRSARVHGKGQARKRQLLTPGIPPRPWKAIRPGRRFRSQRKTLFFSHPERSERSR